MTPHLFALGQAVRLRSGFLPSGDSYLVTALLPPRGDLPQYRIRNEGEKFERMATQAELELLSAPAGGEKVSLLEKSFGVDPDAGRLRTKSRTP